VAGPTGATGGPNIANASVTDQAFTGVDTYLTGSSLSIGGHVKAGTTLRWTFAVSKTAAGTATPQFIVRFGTGATITDTARITFTGAAQTASADNGHFTIQATIRAATATGTVAGVASLLHRGGATGFWAGSGPQIYQVTSTPFDVTGASLVAGVSCNPNTSGAWTFQLVMAEVLNAS
jgi:hypothetical protein